MQTIQESRRLDAAGQELAASCVRLAYQLANRLAHRTSIPVEDAADAALDGLMYAAANYDPARGANFCTFAHLCVRGRLARLVQAHVRAAQRRDCPTVLPFSALAGRDEEFVFDPADGQAIDAGGRLDAQALWDQLERVLPPQLYQTLRLHYVEGQSLADLSQRFGVCKGNISQRLIAARCRVLLRLPQLAMLLG